MDKRILWLDSAADWRRSALFWLLRGNKAQYDKCVLRSIRSMRRARNYAK